MKKFLFALLLGASALPAAAMAMPVTSANGASSAIDQAQLRIERDGMDRGDRGGDRGERSERRGGGERMERREFREERFERRRPRCRIEVIRRETPYGVRVTRQRVCGGGRI